MRNMFIAVLLLGPAAQAQLDCTVKKLEVSGDIDGVCLGTAVAVDGDTVAVASPNDVTIFRRTDDAWVQEDSIGLGGTSLDLCGNTLAIGNVFANGAANGSGAAWIYSRSGTDWSQTAALIASDGENGDYYGYDVAVLPNEVVIGAPRDDTLFGTRGGSAYVYRPDATGWSEVLRLIPADGDLDARFGRAVELEGDRLVIGSPNWQSGQGQPFTGKVYVYERFGTGWIVTADLLPSSGYVDEDFGHSLSLDGDRLAVGTYTLLSFDDPLAYVFAYDGTSWSEDVMLSFPTFGQYFEAGHVALQGDVLAVGEFDIELFQRTTGWNPIGTIQAVADGNPFTGGLALSQNRLVSGAPDVDVPPFDATGIAQIWELGLSTASYCTGKVNSQGCTPTISWTGAPSASDPTPFVVRASDVLNGKNGILFYGLSGRAALPFGGGTLCVQPPLARTPAQTSGGNPPPDDCSGQFAFDFNALIQSGQVPALGSGRVVNGQYWSRDPANADGTGISLADAVELTICP